MTEEKWKIILGRVKDTFEVENTGSEHIEDEGGADIEYVEFVGPLGRMRLEYVTKPVLLDKKTTFSKRIGSGTTIDYIYSKDEKSSKLIAYKWEDDAEDWIEMEAGKMFD